MKRVRRLAVAGLLFVILGVPVVAADPEPPRIPYIARGVCPFEGCQYGTWVSYSPLRVYKTEGDTSVVAFTIAPHEQFQALRGNVHVVKLGEVRVRRPIQAAPGRTLQRGVEISVLAYRGEGRYEIWDRGTFFIAKAFWPPFVPMERPAAEITTWPEMLWWVLVKSTGARQGWLRLRNVSRSGFEFNEPLCTGPC